MGKWVTRGLGQRADFENLTEKRKRATSCNREFFFGGKKKRRAGGGTNQKRKRRGNPGGLCLGPQ